MPFVLKISGGGVKVGNMGRARFLISAVRTGAFRAGALSLMFCISLAAPCRVAAQTELGSEDDLTVLGINGTAADPDTEIKGFTVFGSTQAVYTGAVVGAGNAVVNGYLAVSSGAYFVGGSTFAAGGAYFTGVSSFTIPGNMHVGGGAVGQVLSKVAGGGMQWSSVTDMVSGDNLGSHIATTTLQMGVYGVNTSSDITAARYQINGSTVLAILPGAGSLGIGYNAGKLNAGNGNIFIGMNAGSSTVTGAYNSFVGYQAGHSNTSSDNSFFGWNAGYSNTTGNGNSFFGMGAGVYTTIGIRNSFVGSNAGAYNTTGNYNLMAGFYAGYNTKTGSYNAILGSEAGYGVPSNSFSNSTLVGYRAGYGLSTGSDNILLGWQAGDALTSGARNIVIGYDQDASAATASNELNIGGVLYGDLAAKTIGLSTRVPQAALDVVSTGTVQTQFAQLWRKSDGVIVGSMSATGVMMANKFVGDGSGLTGISAGGGGDSLGTHVATKTLDMAGFQINNVSSMTIIAPDTVASSLWISTSMATSHLYVSTKGYVGIGTENPQAVLDLGAGTSGRSLVWGGRGGNNHYASIGTSYSSADLNILGGLKLDSAADGYKYSYTGTYGAAGIELGTFGGGGDIRFFAEPSAAHTADVSFDSVVNQRMVIKTNGSVGLSTGVPQGRLDVLGTGSTPATMTQIWRNSGGTVISSMSDTGVMMASKFIGDGSGLSGVTATDNTKVLKTGDTMTGTLTINAATAFTTGNQPGLGISTHVFISGNLGINTATPRMPLDVIGGAVFHTGGSDVWT
nr:hypothetical protein [Elusimicrobiota bacterium]